MSNDLIERVRKLVTEGGMSRAGLARAAGLHANTLRDCTSPGWNPTADTLAKLQQALTEGDDSPAVVPIEEIIEEARNGRMFILVDDEDRENEGDLVIPGQMVTPDAINFMATHGRGLICLTLTRARVEELGLELMSRANGTRHETAFTVSIEAREGVSTGISAHDRARTVTVAIDPAKGAAISSRRAMSSPDRPRWRRAGAHRPYRSGSGHFAPRRTQSLRRDLRDHEGRWHDGADGRSRPLCPPPRPQDRHDPRPDRISPPA
jgi:3,4-dihydroxy-2-butanone 4-phosphate synthase